MLDLDTQKYIQQEVEKQLLKERKLNAKNTFFDVTSGRATQGQNVFGPTGRRTTHEVLRTQKAKQKIVSGVINFVSSDMYVETQSGAASDDLDTINPQTLAIGNEWLLLRAYDTTHTVVVKHGTGNITCMGGVDFSLDDINDRILLHWDVANAEWVEFGRNDDIPISATGLGTYTGWTAWSPTYTGSGSMTTSSENTVLARYTQIGKTVFFQIVATMTTGGTASNSLIFTLPITAVYGASNEIAGGCTVTDAARQAGFYIGTSTTTIACRKYDNSNFALAANRSLSCQGFYEVA